MLAESTATEPPAALRSRVLADIATVRPLPPLTGTATPVVTLETRTRPRRFRLAALAAAAAVVAAVSVGGTVWHPWSDDSSQTLTGAAAVLGASDAKTTSLDFDGGASATVTHSDSVGKAVIQTHKMPPPPEGMVYQLWLQQPVSGMVSAGVMPVEGRPDRRARRQRHDRSGGGHHRRARGRVGPPDQRADRAVRLRAERMSVAAPRRVAVIGSGVAGLTAAYVASRSAHVTLFEADDRLGGHADTHQVDGLSIDTGFIVHNERTYPTLLRLFRELGVATQESEMSMSVRDDATGLEWAGALGLRGIFPGGRNLTRPSYLRMLVEIPRFHRAARRLDDDELTLRDFLDQHGFSAYFRRNFMEALVAAVWSCDPDVALDYPARYLFTFLDHHGMLGVKGSPTWRTVTGGSQEYVDPGRGRGGRGAHRHQGHVGARDRHGRRGDRRQRHRHVVRRRRGRHTPGAGPGDARRADGRAARGAGGDPLLPQRRASPHRHLAAPRGRRRPCVVELPSARARRSATSR